MAFSESLLVALFCWAVVFSVLIILFTIIRTFSFALKLLPKKAVEVPAVEEEEFSSGTLKLKDVDEQTAAMIMAIVSDESGIPLSELIFKSIKQIAA
ncbi:MAG: OadG family protein [Sedimentibacter saalensis]|uniref:OadG family protein n=1 Tax=Sedimentibacter saalensis TaxID=130788 RepID=UPI00315962DC